MNKLNEKKNEQGSVLVEVIAVIALLGVMGPLLFRQVMTRNEEVENINIASEIRTLKEGFSAFILSERARLLRDFGSEECIDAGVYRHDIEAYLPYGNEVIEMDPDDGGYYFYLCKNTDEFLQGYIVPGKDAMPSSLGLKRAARIANLIGADGAICQGENINGVAGGWGMTDIGGWCKIAKNVYLATTGMDTYVPEVTFEDYSASLVALPEKLALQDLHAWNYFSVGHTNKNCYELKHNQTGNYSAEEGYTATDDKIYDAGENGCDPLFWVGSVSPSDTKAKGDVYVKNNLMVGQAADGSKKAIGLFHADPTAETDDSAGNKIVVYDNTGNEKVVINGKGEIIAKGETGDSETEETMTMTNQGLKSSLKAKNTDTDENYKVDPAYTSVMNDIKLDSRGGARLSEILPNYISRDIYEITGKETISAPRCPTHYAPAVIVTPTKWENKSTISKDEINTKLKTEEIEVPEGGGNIGSVKITTEEDQNLDVQNADFKITISGGERAHLKSSGSWTIKFLKSDAPDNSTNDEDIREDVKGLVQTYCVYDNTSSGGLNRPN